MISPAPSSHLQRGLFVRARSRSAIDRRRGLSVIELLAATVISLIVMGATVQLFGTVGAQISNGRSNIELSDRVRSAAERLRRDLAGVTVDMRTWNRPEDASGYFEVVKGLQTYWDKNSWQQTQPVPPTFFSASTTPNSSAVTTPGATLPGYTAPLPAMAPVNGPGGIGDGLFFTTRTRDMPFVGRAVNAQGQNIALESQVAEVAWYLQPTNVTPMSTTFTQTIPPTFTLYRRQMLVLPGVGTNVANGTPPAIPASQFYDMSSSTPGTVPLCDISAHPDGVNIWPSTTTMILNSLADLSYRENRFAHYYAPLSGQSDLWGNQNAFGTGTVPFPLYGPALKPFPALPASDPNLRYGEDVVLANVLSFDVKVWDPGAPVIKDPKSSNALVPSDPGYTIPYSSAGTAVLGYGAYVDLDWNNGSAITNPSGAPPCYFAGLSYGQGQKSYLLTSAPSGGGVSPQISYYDTWSAGYEAWLYNPNSGQPQSSIQSFNGFQDPSPVTNAIADGGVDGPNERLTCPPYPVPLRGIQIKIRTYEFSSKQVREVTIQQSFVPD
jgi:hypothetical protein